MDDNKNAIKLINALIDQYLEEPNLKLYDILEECHRNVVAAIKSFPDFLDELEALKFRLDSLFSLDFKRVNAKGFEKPRNKGQNPNKNSVSVLEELQQAGAIHVEGKLPEEAANVFETKKMETIQNKRNFRAMSSDIQENMSLEQPKKKQRITR